MRDEHFRKEIELDNDKWTDEDLRKDKPKKKPGGRGLDDFLSKNLKKKAQVFEVVANSLASIGWTFILDERVYLRTTWKKYKVHCPCDWFSPNEVEMDEIEEQIVYFWQTSDGIVGQVRQGNVTPVKEIIEKMRKISKPNDEYIEAVNKKLAPWEK